MLIACHPIACQSTRPLIGLAERALVSPSLSFHPKSLQIHFSPPLELAPGSRAALELRRQIQLWLHVEPIQWSCIRSLSELAARDRRARPAVWRLASPARALDERADGLERESARAREGVQITKLFKFTRSFPSHISASNNRLTTTLGPARGQTLRRYSLAWPPANQLAVI